MNAKALRILYLCADRGIPYWGSKGSSIHVRAVVEGLAQAGHSVDVVARLDSDDRRLDAGIELHGLEEIEEDSLLDAAARLGADKSAIAELKAFSRNPYLERLIDGLYVHQGYDVVYERYSLFGLAGLKLARRKGLPLVLEVNAPLVEEATKHRKLLLKEVARAVENELFAGADQIIAVSEPLKRYILKLQPRARVAVIPNGVSVEAYDDAKAPAPLWRDSGRQPSRPFGGPSDFVVGFLGRLRPWHGVDVLIDAFASFVQSEARSRLVIIGDEGNLGTELKEKCRQLGIENQVLFTGAVSHDSIPSMLSAMDVLVAPYPDMPDFYFSALKIFEYMAAGKAIIASRIGQIAEVLQHEKTGLLVTAGNAAALAEAMLRLARDPEVRKVLGENARREAFQKHSWQNRIGQITDLLRQVIGERPLAHG